MKIYCITQSLAFSSSA